METVHFSTVHDICTERETVNTDSADNSAKLIFPIGETLQGDLSNNLLIEALPVDKPGEYLSVDTPGEHLPLNVPGTLEQSNLPGKGQVEAVMGSSIDEVEVTSVVESSDVPEKAEQQSEDEIDTLPRRSVRQRGEPERLTYFQPGNPLIYVVQSLFQCLNSAFVKSLGGDENLNVLPLLPNGLHSVVTSQPSRTCKGTCMNLGGENVTQVK